MNENTIIGDRMAELRTKMKELKIDWYLIPTGDFHNSEYVNDYFKVREYFSGFTGSNGTLLVGMEMAGLWTDGRYFIQAEHELTGTGIFVFRMMEEGVPTILEFLQEHMQEEEQLGFDGRVVTTTFGLKLEEQMSKNGCKIKYDATIAEQLWIDRPSLPAHPLILLERTIAGETVNSKLQKIRTVMREKNTDCHILSKLDDIMWLFNIRGSDIPCNPVAFSFAIIFHNKGILFLQKNAITDSFREVAEKENIEFECYENILDYLSSLKKQKILLDCRNSNYIIYKMLLKNHIVVDAPNPTSLLKAMKNPIEQKNMQEIYRKDSAAVTKFIYWIKNIVKEKVITELEAASYLDTLRSEIPGFLDLSFDTISAYKENAAMMHYKATLEHNKVLYPEGMLLIDSGGQYLGGTTDVTRTIVLGSIPYEQKIHFTHTCIGMINLMNAKFLYGCTGRNLDILARQSLWNIETDYKCGTGHGIGYILNVHEGPQSIRWRNDSQNEETILEEGMVISNEPGVYIENKYGIRIENIMICKKGPKNEYGQFMYFEPLTYVPIDREALELSVMTEHEIEKINQYHQEVYLKISPYLSESESEWLKKVTQPLHKQTI